MYFTDLQYIKHHLKKKLQKKWKKVAIKFAGKEKCITFALAITKIANASLAQLVEHDTLNVGVQGSSPWGGTKDGNHNDFRPFFV